VDSRDFSILAALFADSRQSYRSLGRRIGLTAPAVRERLGRLERQGTLTGYGLWVNPLTFGREELLLTFKRERNKDEVREILGEDDVAYIGWKIDGGLTVGLVTANKSESIRKLEAALNEKTEGQFSVRSTNPLPLSRLDLQLLDALVDAPTIPLREIMSRTGLSPKTVRKHLLRLFDTGTIIIMPKVGVENPGSGEIVYQLSVYGKVRLDSVLRVLQPAVLLRQAETPPAKFLLCRSSSLADVAMKMTRVGQLPGVDSARLSINREHLFSPQLMHTLIEMEMRELERAR